MMTTKLSLNELFFHTNQIGEATSLVKKYHYSKRVPAIIQFIGTFHTSGGLFGDFGEAVAAVMFGLPAARWSEPVTELSRLVRKDDVNVPLTSLISLSCKYLKKNGYDLLISYADVQENHHGGIYQACSWNYFEQRKSAKDGILLDGIFIPGRSCNSNWGTSSIPKLKEILKNDKIEPHYDIGKHLYWRALNRKGKKKAERLNFGINPYPKPDLN